MIASFLRNFVFIKTRKTAGTSVEMALAPYCGPDDVVTPISPQDESDRMVRGVVQARNFADPTTEEGYRAAIAAGPSPKTRAFIRAMPLGRFYNHMAAAEVREKLPAPFWNEAFKFTIERHPYEKIASLAWMLVSSEKLTLEAALQKAILVIAGDQDLYRIGGKVIVDRILRYEALDCEMAEVTEQLGIPRLSLPRAKSRFRMDRRPAVELLSVLQRKSIARALGPTFELMGYAV